MIICRVIIYIIVLCYIDAYLADFQHFSFQEYKDTKGDSILSSNASCSVTFQLAQMQVGQGTVQISIVLYIEETFIMLGNPIQPVYFDLLYDIT